MAYYCKEPKSVTIFNLFSFFRADLIQSEVNLESVLGFWLDNDCTNECELIKSGHTFGLLAVKWKGQRGKNTEKCMENWHVISRRLFNKSDQLNLFSGLTFKDSDMNIY